MTRGTRLSVSHDFIPHIFISPTRFSLPIPHLLSSLSLISEADAGGPELLDSSWPGGAARDAEERRRRGAGGAVARRSGWGGARRQILQWGSRISRPHGRMSRHGGSLHGRISQCGGGQPHLARAAVGRTAGRCGGAGKVSPPSVSPAARAPCGGARGNGANHRAGGSLSSRERRGQRGGFGC
jgi:hypothetical protein